LNPHREPADHDCAYKEHCSELLESMKKLEQSRMRAVGFLSFRALLGLSLLIFMASFFPRACQATQSYYASREVAAREQAKVDREKQEQDLKLDALRPCVETVEVVSINSERRSCAHGGHFEFQHLKDDYIAVRCVCPSQERQSHGDDERKGP